MGELAPLPAKNQPAHGGTPIARAGARLGQPLEGHLRRKLDVLKTVILNKR